MDMPSTTQSTAISLSLLRWRARRGLLENDLIFERFFDQFGDQLTENDQTGLMQLLELADNELLDLILCRTEPTDALANPQVEQVLRRLRTV